MNQVMFRLNSKLPYLLLILSCACTSLGQEQYRRVALVIGNSKYENMGTLKNPVNDARAISKSLALFGFQVTTKFDRDKFEIESDLDEVTKGLRPGDAVFFFFAGHGLQIDNTNYLVPVGAKISREFHIKQRCVSLGYALAAMEDSDASLKVVMLDACRDNPFRSFTRSQTTGLAAVEAPEGTIVAFSTAPGAVANDGAGNNSPFTKHLVGTLAKSPENGIEITDMFRSVARAVKDETGQRAYLNSDASMDPFLLRPVSLAKASRTEAPKKPSAEMISVAAPSPVNSDVAKAPTSTDDIKKRPRKLTSPQGWLADFAIAQQQSRSSEKPLVAFFAAGWGPSKTMITGVLPDQSVKTALKDFVPVYVDFDQQPEIARKYKVQSLPTFVCIDIDGSEAARHAGAVDTKAFLNLLLQFKKTTTKENVANHSNPKINELMKELKDLKDEFGPTHPIVKMKESQLKDELDLAARQKTRSEDLKKRLAQ